MRFRKTPSAKRLTLCGTNIVLPQIDDANDTTDTHRPRDDAQETKQKSVKKDRGIAELVPIIFINKYYNNFYKGKSSNPVGSNSFLFRLSCFRKKRNLPRKMSEELWESFNKSMHNTYGYGGGDASSNFPKVTFTHADLSDLEAYHGFLDKKSNYATEIWINLLKDFVGKEIAVKDDDEYDKDEANDGGGEDADSVDDDNDGGDGDADSVDNDGGDGDADPDDDDNDGGDGDADSVDNDGGDEDEDKCRHREGKIQLSLG